MTTRTSLPGVFACALLSIVIGAVGLSGAGCKAGPEAADASALDAAPDIDESCVNAKCQNPAAMCCNDVPCVDVTLDNNNCGKCGNVCGTGEICITGTCQCIGGGDGGTTMACSAGQACCPGPLGSGCTSVTTDVANCGSCGHACQAMETCESSQCQCGKGAGCTGTDTCCGSGCIDTQTDAMNCGKCGNACPAGKPCMGGVCEGQCTGCTTGEKCCGFTCSKVLSDPMNCGKCGNVCPPWLGGPGQCILGSCLELHIGDGGTRDM